MIVLKRFFSIGGLFLFLLSSSALYAQKTFLLHPQNLDSIYQLIRNPRICPSSSVDTGLTATKDPVYRFLVNQLGIKGPDDDYPGNCTRLYPTRNVITPFIELSFRWAPYRINQARYEMRSYNCRSDEEELTETTTDSISYVFDGQTRILSFVGFCDATNLHSLPTIIIADKDLFSRPVTDELSEQESRERTNQQLRISPNPCTTWTCLEWTGDREESVQIQLFSLRNNQVQQWTFAALPGKNTYELLTGDLPPGCYAVRIRGEQTKLQQLFCKTE